jgi:hypothetical protein
VWVKWTAPNSGEVTISTLEVTSIRRRRDTGSAVNALTLVLRTMTLPAKAHESGEVNVTGGYPLQYLDRWVWRLDREHQSPIESSAAVVQVFVDDGTVRSGL